MTPEEQHALYEHLYRKAKEDYPALSVARLRGIATAGVKAEMLREASVRARSERSDLLRWRGAFTKPENEDDDRGWD